MIRELSIANLGVIEQTRLGFSPGFTVLTGETGAGKTLITTALSQLLGARPDVTLVRHAASEAVIDCVLAVPEASRAQLEELGATFDGDDLLVTRTIGSSSRSRAIVGSRSVAAATLAEIVGASVTLHGQHGQTRLMKPSEQRALLDAAGGLSDHLEAQRDVWHRLREVRAELHEATAQQSSTTAELERLQQFVADVEAVAPTPNEDVDLNERIEALSSADEIQQLCIAAHALLAGDGDSDGADALELVSRLRKLLEHATFPGPFAEWAERAVEIGELVTALAHDIDRYSTILESDPSALEQLQLRKAAIGGLQRRWNCSLDALIERYAAAAEQLAFAADPAGRISELQARALELEAEQTRTCGALHTARTAAAATLAAAVQTELRYLGLTNAGFEIHVDSTGEPNQFGDDAVEFMFSANPGMPLQPLAAVGSGGELSRVMLALEVAAADTREHTFIFDEVDAGIGGKAALEVGKRLAHLAATQQVIVVTHLAQVAVFADHHIVVEKEVRRDATLTSARTLTEADRAAEVARMLSGVEESAAATAHADELLLLAAETRRVVG